MSLHESNRIDALRLSRRQWLAGAGASAAGAWLCGCQAAAKALEPAPSSGAAAQEQREQLDQLLGDLSDQSALVEPISVLERSLRRERLGAVLRAQQLDALLVEPGPTLEYLTGVRWGLSERLFALLALANGAHVWIVPAFEEPKARLKLGAAGFPADDTLLAWAEHEYPWQPLASLLRERGVERLAFEPGLRYFAADKTTEACGPSVSVHSGAAVVRALRGRKDAHEIALLRHANELTQRAIRAVAERLEPGWNGAEVGAALRRAQERLGLVEPWVLPLIGPAAAFPHGDHSAECLAPGKVLLVDTGGTLHGYQSDITRTWAFDGRVDSEVERVWQTVRDAQKRAFEALRPGVSGASIDQAARELITERGFGAGYASFTHRLGHGIGMEGHEEPYFDGGNQRPLEVGNTLSNEPGIYLYGRFGVRLEDIVLVTESGATSFGTWQQSPASPA